MSKELVASCTKAKIYSAKNILFVIMDKETQIEINDAKEITQTLKDLEDFSKTAMLIDISKMLFISKDARKHFAEQTDPNIKAIAIIMSSAIQKTFANMYLKFANPQIPTRMFLSEDEAIRWLVTQSTNRNLQAK